MKKYDNFCNALLNLKDIYNYQEPYSNVEMTGLVGLFEICFEQSWKAIKEVLLSGGFTEGQTGSPRQIIHDTKDKYYQMFMDLKSEIEKNWI